MRKYIVFILDWTAVEVLKQKVDMQIQSLVYTPNHEI